MSSVKSLISKISKVLQDTGEPSLAKHQQSYMKNVVKFYGIRIPAAREKILDTFSKEIKALTGPQAIQVATGLVASEYSEDKAGGVTVLAKNISKLSRDDIPALGKMFDDEYIYDWSTTDSISSTVICEVMKKDPTVATILQEWKDSPVVWKQRTCVVSTHRFVQLGVGWVLRELYLHDADGGGLLSLVGPLASRLVAERTVRFIKDNYGNFSREGLRYAIEKMDTALRSSLMQFDPDGTTSNHTTNTNGEHPEEEASLVGNNGEDGKPQRRKRNAPVPSSSSSSSKPKKPKHHE